jgi:hypothetical protein
VALKGHPIDDPELNDVLHIETIIHCELGILRSRPIRGEPHLPCNKADSFWALWDVTHHD